MLDVDYLAVYPDGRWLTYPLRAEGIPHKVQVKVNFLIRLRIRAHVKYPVMAVVYWRNLLAT